MCQNLENQHLRRALGMRPEATGVMINTIQPTSNAAKVGVDEWGGRGEQEGVGGSTSIMINTIQPPPQMRPRWVCRGEGAGRRGYLKAQGYPLPNWGGRAASPSTGLQPSIHPHFQVIRKGDVLLEFDGVPVANDGTVHLRHRERIYFSYLITLKPTGASSRVKVWGRSVRGIFTGLRCGTEVWEAFCSLSGNTITHQSTNKSLYPSPPPLRH